MIPNPWQFTLFKLIFIFHVDVSLSCISLKKMAAFFTFFKDFSTKYFIFSVDVHLQLHRAPPTPEEEKNSPSPPHSSTPLLPIFSSSFKYWCYYLHMPRIFSLLFMRDLFFWDINNHTKIFHNSHWGPCGLSSSWSSYFNCCVLPLPGH